MQNCVARTMSLADADGAAAGPAPMPPPGKGEARLAEAPPPHLIDTSLLPARLPVPSPEEVKVLLMLEGVTLNDSNITPGHRRWVQTGHV